MSRMGHDLLQYEVATVAAIRQLHAIFYMQF